MIVSFKNRALETGSLAPLSGLADWQCIMAAFASRSYAGLRHSDRVCLYLITITNQS